MNAPLRVTVVGGGIAGLAAAHRGLELVGAAYRGIGIANSIKAAEDAADRLLAALGRG